MRGIRLRSTVKSVIAIVCAACFLTMSLGSVSRAIAADTWETWPKKTAEPGVQPPPPPAEGAAAPGPAAVISSGLSFVLRSQANVEADSERLADLFADRAIEFYRRQGWL